MAGFDFNTAEVSEGFGDLLPDGLICLVEGRLRRQGATAPQFNSPEDAEVFKLSKDGLSYMADWEFTVRNGRFANRKVWQLMTVQTQKEDDGSKKAVNIAMSTLRSMVESATGTHPKDETEAARQKRYIPYFTALEYFNNHGDSSGILFVAKIGIDKGKDGYADKNKISQVITPDRKEWAVVMQEGKDIVPASAGGGFGGVSGGFGAAPTQAPSFGGAPAGGFGGAQQGGFAAPQQAPAQVPQQQPQSAPAQAAQAQPAFTPAAGFHPAGAVAGTGAPQLPSWTR